jgi:kynurenine formamidase
MDKIRMVDLTYTVSSEMLVYPGTERPTFQWIGRVNSEGYNLTRMTMLVHTGTHVDAPKHFLDQVRSIDEIPLDSFLGPCKMFKYLDKPNNQEIDLKTVLKSGFDLSAGDIFLMSTGIAAYSETQDYNFLYPFPSEDLLEWLIDKKIKAYMTDATSVDPVNGKNSPRHKMLFGAGIPIVENLCNLEELPINKHFIISALPLKLGDREGSPCRAIALPDMEELNCE